VADASPAERQALALPDVCASLTHEEKHETGQT
jgi:hypothetical protein